MSCGYIEVEVADKGSPKGNSKEKQTRQMANDCGSFHSIV